MHPIECVAQRRQEGARRMHVQKSAQWKRGLCRRRARESLQYGIDVTQVVMRARVRCLYRNWSDRAIRVKDIRENVSSRRDSDASIQRIDPLEMPPRCQARVE